MEREDERGAAVRDRPASGVLPTRPRVPRRMTSVYQALCRTTHARLGLPLGSASAQYVRLFVGNQGNGITVIRFPLDFFNWNAIACSATFILARRTRQDRQLGKYETSVVNAARRRSGREHAAEVARY